MSAALGVSLLGAGLGAATANATMGNDDSSTNNTVFGMNQILNQALGSALNASNNETSSAIAQQNASLGTATNALNSGLTAANQAVATGVNTGTAENQALNSSTVSAGDQALDQYMNTLGLAVPVGGFQNQTQNLYNSAQLAPTLQSLQAAGTSTGLNPYTAAVAPSLSSMASQMTPQQIQQYLAQNNQGAQSYGNEIYSYGGTTPSYGNANTFTSLADLEANPQAQAYAANQLAQPGYNTALGNYNTLNSAQQSLGSQISQLGVTPSGLAQAAAYNSGQANTVKQ